MGPSIGIVFMDGELKFIVVRADYDLWADIDQEMVGSTLADMNKRWNKSQIIDWLEAYLKEYSDGYNAVFTNDVADCAQLLASLSMTEKFAIVIDDDVDFDDIKEQCAWNYGYWSSELEDLQDER